MSWQEVYWSESIKCWLRFTFDSSGKVEVYKTVSADTQYPNYFTDWEILPATEKGPWFLNYDDQGTPTNQLTFLIKKGKLLQTDWQSNSLTNLQEIAHIEKDGLRIKYRGTNPFAYVVVPILSVTPYEEITLTPEQNQHHWQQWRRENVREQLAQNSAINSFSEEQNNTLCYILTRDSELNPQDYDNPIAYIKDLKAAIDDVAAQVHHSVILRLAAQTHDDLDLKFDDESSVDLRKRKQTFFIDLLKAELANLLSFLKLKPAIKKSSPVFSVLPRREAQIEAQSKEPDLYADIQIAVVEALLNYQQWYKGKNLRGANGFFTWLRHGKAGQKRAQHLCDEVIKAGCNRENEVKETIRLINDFLGDSKTRFHRHSFSSFLLDRLIKIENSPWRGLVVVPNTGGYQQDALKSRHFAVASSQS